MDTAGLPEYCTGHNGYLYARLHDDVPKLCVVSSQGYLLTGFCSVQYPWMSAVGCALVIVPSITDWARRTFPLELYCYLRSPYRDLAAYDRNVQVGCLIVFASASQHA